MNDLSKTDLMQTLEEAFPALDSRQDLKQRTRSEWIGARSELLMLIPDDIDILPFVLVDMANTVEESVFKSGRDVIYFLEVNRPSHDAGDLKNRKLVNRFADEQIGGLAAEELKAMAAYEVPKATGDPSRREIQEAVVNKLTSAQRRGIYLFLCYIEPFVREFEMFHSSVLNAAAYWNSEV